MIAGVSTGVARWLNIDPVIVRIGFVVLAFIGLAGFILYAAGWLLLPEEGKERSVVGEAFGVANDEQVRIVGLLVAGALAVLAVVGDGAWGLGHWGWAGVWIAFWIGAPIALVYWLVRGRHGARAEATGQQQPVIGPPLPPPGTPGAASTPHEPGAPVPPGAATTAPVRPPNGGNGRNWSPALFLGTASVLLLAWGAMWLWSLETEPFEASVYAAVGLGITALGLLVGSKAGDAGLLIPVGIVLAFVLAFTSAMPSARSGDFQFTPVNTTQATRTLETGAGQVTYDLTKVSDPEDLAGRSVQISHGAGLVRVVVPRELDVEVDARVRWGGQVDVFERRSEGWDARVHTEPDGDEPFKIDITSTVGVIEVIRS